MSCGVSIVYVCFVNYSNVRKKKNRHSLLECLSSEVVYIWRGGTEGNADCHSLLSGMLSGGMFVPPLL